MDVPNFIEQFLSQGWAVSDNFLSESECTELHSEASIQRYEAASVGGRDYREHVNTDVRQSQFCPLSRAAGPCVSRLISTKIDELLWAFRISVRGRFNACQC